MIYSRRKPCKYDCTGFALCNRNGKKIKNREDKIADVENKDHIEAVSFFSDPEEAEKESNKSDGNDNVNSGSNIGEVDFIRVIF